MKQNREINPQEWEQIVDAAFSPDAAEPQFSAAYKEKKQRLMQRTAAAQKPVHRRMHRMIAFAAAACLALTGITAAAATADPALFRRILSRTQMHEGPSEPLAAAGEESSPLTTQNLNAEDILFAGDSSIQIAEAGMLHDSNTLMLSLQLTPQQGTKLPADALFIPYFESLSEDGTVLQSFGGLGQTEPLTADDVTNQASLTYYLAVPELSGNTLRVTLQNAYSQAQLEAVYQGIRNAQDTWAAEYGRDQMSVEEWKQLWQSEHLDQRTADTAKQLLAESDCMISGTWTADLAIPALPADSVLTAEQDGWRAAADTLSLRTYDSADLGSDNAVFVVRFTDGTVLYSQSGTGEEALLRQEGVLDESCVPFAYQRGTEDGSIFSYPSPHSSDTVAELHVYRFRYENGISFSDILLYSAE